MDGKPSSVDNIVANMAKLHVTNRRRSSFGDRFIPNRRGSDAESVESAYRRLTSADTSQNDSISSAASSNASDLSSPWTPKGGRNAKRHSSISADDRILVFSPRTPVKSATDNIPDLQDCTTPHGYSPRRYLPKSPDRILDMPDVRDDFYCNILDWSNRNNITVAITDMVYSWNVDNEACQSIPISVEDSLPPAIVKSLAWDHMGKRLAIGTVEGDIRIWNKEKKIVSQYMVIHEGKMVGETDGVVWDRMGNTIFGLHSCGFLSQIDTKHGEIEIVDLHLSRGAAGLKLCEDNKHLAIGANDGTIIVWNIQEHKIRCHIEAHSTATKALAWLPWKKHTLFSGGGSGDGTIRMWHTKTGEMLNEVQTNSQVCSMVISGVHREMVTGHGIEHNDIIIWSLPSMQIVGKLQYQGGRVLHLALNVKEDMLASMSADEALMLWKCFGGVARKTSRMASCPIQSKSPLSFSIR